MCAGKRLRRVQKRKEELKKKRAWTGEVTKREPMQLLCHAYIRNKKKPRGDIRGNNEGICGTYCKIVDGEKS